MTTRTAGIACAMGSVLVLAACAASGDAARDSVPDNTPPTTHCEVINQHPAREDRLVRGPYPSAEDIVGLWSGGYQARNGWRTLLLDFSCDAPEVRDWRDLGHGLAARLPFRIDGRAVHFTLQFQEIAPDSNLHGELVRRDIRGTVERGGAFFLERVVDLDPALAQEYEGMYSTSYLEFTNLRLHNGDLVMHDARDAVRLRPISREEFHTPLQSRVMIHRDQVGPVGQIEVQSWDGELIAQGNKRDWRITSAHSLANGTAFVYHNTRNETPTPLVIIASAEGHPYDLHSTAVADEYFMKGLRAMDLAPGSGPEDARAAIEFLREHENDRILFDQLVLYAEGDEGLAIIADENLIGQFAVAAFVSMDGALPDGLPPVPLLVITDDDATDERRDAIAQWNNRAESEWRFDSEARAMPGLADPLLAGEDHLWRYPAEFFEALLVFTREALPEIADHQDEVELE